MKAFLVYKDGRRREMDFCGAVSIVVPTYRDGRWYETMFDSKNELSDEGVLYFEGETKDVTEQVKKASREVQEMVDRVIRKGLGLE